MRYFSYIISLVMIFLFDDCSYNFPTVKSRFAYPTSRMSNQLDCSFWAGDTSSKIFLGLTPFRLKVHYDYDSSLQSLGQNRFSVGFFLIESGIMIPKTLFPTSLMSSRLIFPYLDLDWFNNTMSSAPKYTPNTESPQIDIGMLLNFNRLPLDFGMGASYERLSKAKWCFYTTLNFGLQWRSSDLEIATERTFGWKSKFPPIITTHEFHIKPSNDLIAGAEYTINCSIKVIKTKEWEFCFILDNDTIKQGVMNPIDTTFSMNCIATAGDHLIECIIDPNNKLWPNKLHYNQIQKIYFKVKRDSNNIIAPVQIQPSGGKFFHQPTLVISCRTKDVKIRYTLDGSIPDVKNGLEYTGPFKLPFGNSTINAYAFANGMETSPIITETYSCDSILLQIKPIGAVDHSELYETYRRGTITRHMCSDGFLGGSVWMSERYDKDLEHFFRFGTDPLANLCNSSNSFGAYNDYLQHIRSREERYDNEGLKDNFWFIPMCGEDNKIVSNNEENHLLNAGLMLAAFSMEGLKDIDTIKGVHLSKMYADLLFEFILHTETRRNGMMYRVNTDADRTEIVKYASTDDLLGVCVGLSYYLDLLEKCNDTYRIQQLRSFAYRVGKLLTDHGCFYLPPSNTVNDDIKKNIRLEFSKQFSFIFAYPLKLFFKKAADLHIDVDWNYDEYRAYFPESHILPDGWDEFLFGENVTNQDKIMWLVDVVDKSFLDKEGTYENFLSTYKNAINGNVDDCILGSAAIAAFIGGSFTGNPLFTFNATSMTIELVSANVNISKKLLTENYYNLHLTALSIILATKLNRPYNEGASFMRTILSTRINDSSLPDNQKYPGRYNSLFAVVAAWNKANEASNPNVKDALDFLAQGSDPAINMCMQHDLPVSKNGDNEFNSKNIPKYLNPLNQLGMYRMFEKPNYIWIHNHGMSPREKDLLFQTIDEQNSIEGKTINNKLIIRNSSLIVESAEVTWMFASMLAMYHLKDTRFNIVFKEKIQYPVLPYTGHIPPGLGLRVLSKKPNPGISCDAKYQDFSDGPGVLKGKFFMEDINGDSTSDLVYAFYRDWEGQKGLEVRTKISREVGWESNGQIFTDGEGVLNGNFFMGDINSDNKSDLVYTFFRDWGGVKGLEVRVKISKGDGTWGSVGQIFSDGKGVLNGHVLLGDVNGDSKSDLVFAFFRDWGGSKGLEVRTKISRGDGTWDSYGQLFSDGDGVLGGKVLMGDVNNDGKSDLVFAFFRNWGGKQGLEIRTKESKGDGTWESHGQLFTDGEGVLDGKFNIGDVNGDKRSDVVYAFFRDWGGEKGLEVRTKLSNGNGTWESKGQVFPDGEGVLKGTFLMGDINGDQKSDLIYTFFNNWGEQKGMEIRSKFFDQGQWISQNKIFSNDNYNFLGHVLLGDTDGDNKSEVVYVY